MDKYARIGAGIWIVGVLGLLIVGILGYMAFQPTASVPGITPTTPGATIELGCDKTQQVTVTLSAVDKYTGVAVGGSHGYRVNDGSVSTVSDKGTFTATPEDKLEVLYGNASTNGPYFGNHVVIDKIPCKATYNPSETLDAYKLVQNTSATISVYNEEGNQISEGANNETIGAGESSSMEVTFRAESEKGFPNGGMFYLQFNNTDFDSGKIDFELDGLNLVKETAVPSILTVSNVDNKFIVWRTTDPIEGAALRKGSLNLEAKTATTNPGSVNDPVLYFRPSNYYYDNEVMAGPDVEDEDGVATFAHVSSFTIHLN